MGASPVDPRRVLRSPRLLLAFGFGSGLSPWVPGTMGTLAAVPLFLTLAALPWWAYAAVVVAAFAVGIYLCAHAAAALGVHDHPGIVWDEFVGYWITMFLVPVSWQWVLAGFVLFRLFDMLKPWPISLADKKLHGGFGIMIDDVLAGIAAWLCLHILIRVL